MLPRQRGDCTTRMATHVVAPQRPTTPADGELRPFTYRDLLAMERSGIIGEDERVELLGGRIYRMTIKPPHAWAVSSLTQKFSVAFDGCATVASQQPLPLSDDLDATELPQPDAMLLQEGTYPDHPRPHHVLLLVEFRTARCAKTRPSSCRSTLRSASRSCGSSTSCSAASKSTSLHPALRRRLRLPHVPRTHRDACAAGVPGQRTTVVAAGQSARRLGASGADRDRRGPVADAAPGHYLPVVAGVSGYCRGR